MVALQVDDDHKEVFKTEEELQKDLKDVFNHSLNPKEQVGYLNSLEMMVVKQG